MALEDAAENEQRLLSCSGHVFVEVPAFAGRASRKACSRCRGFVTHLAAKLYVQGWRQGAQSAGVDRQGIVSSNMPTNLPSQLQEQAIKRTKSWRKALDAVLQEIKADDAVGYPHASDERTIARLKITEAVMWLGMDLKGRGGQSPYPNSYNPDNATVDPVAEGLKL